MMAAAATKARMATTGTMRRRRSWCGTSGGGGVTLLVASLLLGALLLAVAFRGGGGSAGMVAAFQQLPPALVARSRTSICHRDDVAPEAADNEEDDHKNSCKGRTGWTSCPPPSSRLMMARPQSAGGDGDNYDGDSRAATGGGGSGQRNEGGARAALRNGDGNAAVEQIDGDDEDDFAGWIQGLSEQWPLRQTARVAEAPAGFGSSGKEDPPSPMPRGRRQEERRRGEETDEEEEGEEDNAAWIQSLNQWPLRGDKKNKNADGIVGGVTGQQQRQPKRETGAAGIVQQQQQSSSSRQLPLTNFLNMEALLALGQQSASNATRLSKDLLLPAGSSLLKSVRGGKESFDGFIFSSWTSIFAAGESVLNATEEMSNWGSLIGGIQGNLLGNPYGFSPQQQGGQRGERRDDGSRGEAGGKDGTFPGGLSAERVLKLATDQIESIVTEASSVLSPKTMEEFLVQASDVLKMSSPSFLYENATTTTTTTAATADASSATATDNNLVQAASDFAAERGLDVQEVANRAKETIEFSKDFVTTADGVYRKGYVPGDPISQKDYLADSSVPPVKGSRALFADFKSATEINELSPTIAKAAEMGALAGTIYEDNILDKHELGHSIVATGYTEDVFWMVTDSISSQAAFQDYGDEDGDASEEPVLVRTITIRGYDASDSEVDREGLVVRVVNGEPVQLSDEKKNHPACKDLLFHSGLLGIAKALYNDLKQYVMWTPPSHKIVLNGHSIGGSLSLLLLFLMTIDLGADFVKYKILRVFTFGSPPIVRRRDSDNDDNRRSNDEIYHCPILEKFELPSSLVQAYVQPWDPIVRLFTPIDPLYPLVDDVADDGVTPWQSGPPRTLRPIAKAILEAWDGWPTFRDTFQGGASQSYSAVGVQHVLVPEPTRYLSDRFVAVNIPVPPIEAILRIASAELLPALSVAFPLDTFEISYIPQTIRSFVHHFFPAYGIPMVDYVKRLEQSSNEMADLEIKDWDLAVPGVNASGEK